ncbi:MAG: efflux RND transporter permease subunit [bacterium]
MSALLALLARPRLVLASALLLAANGLLLYGTMARQEDPRLPDRWGLVVVTYPGADAEKVERLVLERLEESLAEVEQLHRIEGTARAGVAIVSLELRPDISDVEPAWDRVRRRLTAARLPAEASRPVLDADLTDQESVVLAVTGAADPLALADGAELLEDALESLPAVARVLRAGDPGEQVTIALDDAVARRLGLSAAAVAAQLQARTATLPGGAVEAAGRLITLRPESALRTVEELARTPILLPSGAAVALAEVADVRRRPAEPALDRARIDGAAAVVLGVVPRRGTDVVAFGEAVRARVAEVSGRIAPLGVQEIAFQPARVEARLDDLGQSLLLGILIVAGVLVATMGLRLGLVVAAVVPLVAFASVGIYGLAGGVLHQMSISALVIALGLLVDNAIVVTESVQGHLDAGLDRRAAALAAIRELALPLAAATGTTLAAFVPMLLAEGPTGDFTRALPIVIMLTLTLSYGFAVLVTPVLSAFFLRPQPGAVVGRGAAVGRFAVRHRRLVLAGAVVLVGASVVAAGGLPFRFFPSSDRNQLVLDVQLPEGTHLSATDEAARVVEGALRDRPDVASVASFVGRSVPHFYYNLPRLPASPHLAQLLITTRSTADLPAVARAATAALAARLPEADLVARRLEQGPPIKAPIELRLYSDDPVALQAGVEQAMALVRGLPGARDVRHDLGLGVPVLGFEIDDAAAGRQGVSRVDVARALLGRTRGLTAGAFEVGDDPVPLVIRSAAGERLPIEALTGVDVGPRSAAAVPLGQVARADVQWRAAAIHHRGGQRVATITAQLAEGVAFSAVYRPLQAALQAHPLPGVRVEQGGEAEGADEANSSLFRSLPVGIFLLVFILLAEFNSFRRVAIILVTVPLAATGVIPGLLVGGQAFGFMSMLGVIALIGIVVNNAIVLLDVADRRLDGATPTPEALEAALAEAVRLRTRPILLTTATTVAGLLPLVLSGTTLWPPMAWAMISGLLASTVLTLLVVPALYRVAFRPRRLVEVPA